MQYTVLFSVLVIQQWAVIAVKSDYSLVHFDKNLGFIVLYTQYW